MNARGFARQRARLEQRHQGATLRRAMMHLVREARARVVIVNDKPVGFILPNGEVVCEKRRYRSEDAAVAELQGIHQFDEVNAARRVPVRAYRCPYCRGWHLTSRA